MRVREPEQGGDGLGVPDRTGGRHPYRPSQGKESQCDKFVFFGLSFALVESLGQVDGHRLVDEPRADIEMEHAFPAVGRKAGFFDQFAFGRGQFIFTFVDAAGGEFPKKVIGTVAVLAGEQHPWLFLRALFLFPASEQRAVFDGHDDDRTRMADDVSAHDHTTGFLDLVGGDLENRAAIDDLGGEDAYRFAGGGFPLACHRNTITNRADFVMWAVLSGRQGLLSCAAMSTQPSVTIVGPGNLGGALAVALREAGYGLLEMVYRGDRKRAAAIARRCGAVAISFAEAKFQADVLWLCVADAEIASVASAASGREWKDKSVFHSSGALASDELKPLKRKGAAVASVHPMMSFVRNASVSFAGVTFALEGDVAAKKIAARIVCDLGAFSFELKKAHKPLYHALGAFSSPLLIAHLAAAEKIGKKLGLKPEQTRHLIEPILQKTLRNYLEHGAAAALSGPLVRGDVETVRKNLRALQRVPGAPEIFRALVKMAANELPVKRKAEIVRLLSE